METLLRRAAVLIIEHRKANASFLFSSLKISYKEALGLIQELEKLGALGPYIENEEREILIPNIAALNQILPGDKKGGKSVNESGFQDSLTFVEDHMPESVYEKIRKIEVRLDEINSKGGEKASRNERKLLLSELKQLQEEQRADEKRKLAQQKINNGLSNTQNTDDFNIYVILFYALMLYTMVLFVFWLISV